MKYKKILAILAALALILTACGPAEDENEVPTMTTEPTTVATDAPVLGTETAAASPAPEVTETTVAGAEMPTSGIPVTGEATINVSESTEFGPILVDDEGLALYMFMNDTQDGESSACNDECVAEWPPLLTEGSPIAGEGVDSTLLGTITREDGTMQVTYNGWPLYRYVEDQTLGDADGHGMENLWFLVTPEGEALR